MSVFAGHSCPLFTGNCGPCCSPRAGLGQPCPLSGLVPVPCTDSMPPRAIAGDWRVSRAGSRDPLARRPLKPTWAPGGRWWGRQTGAEAWGAGRAPGPAAQTQGLPAGAVCLVCFSLATCFSLQSGSYWLEVFDNYLAALNLILFAFFEVVSVAYVYGLER